MKFTNLRYGEPSTYYLRVAFMYELACKQLSYAREGFYPRIGGEKQGAYKMQYLAFMLMIDYVIREALLGKPTGNPFVFAEDTHIDHIKSIVRQYDFPDFDIKFESLKFIPYFSYEDNTPKVNDNVYMKLLDYAGIEKDDYNEYDYNTVINLLLKPWIKQFISYAEHEYGQIIYYYSDVNDDNVATDDDLICSVCQKSMKGQRYVYYKSLTSDEKPFCKDCFDKAKVSPYGHDAFRRVEIATGREVDQTVYYMGPPPGVIDERSLFQKIKDLVFKKDDNGWLYYKPPYYHGNSSDFTRVFSKYYTINPRMMIF